MSKGELIEGAIGVGTSLLSGDAVGAAISGLPMLRNAIKACLPNATDALLEAIAEEIQSAVFERIPALEKAVKRLSEHSPGEPRPAAGLGILESFVRAYVRAEKGKREQLLNALVNAFDPEIYEASMTRRLFELLDQLDYGDLSYLRAFAAKPEGQEKPWDSVSAMSFSHATRLVEAGVMFRYQQGAMFLHTDRAAVTGIGRQLLKFIAAHPVREKRD